MSYTALYRKFRPQEFKDVKGQDHIVTTLKNQIEADRIGHAYLLQRANIKSTSSMKCICFLSGRLMRFLRP